MNTLSDFVQTRVCELEAVTLVGFQGQSMDEENELFDQLTTRSNEIPARKNDHQYLVVSGSNPTPVVAVEVEEISSVPESMTSYTIPSGEYVVFSFEERFIGDFWQHVCSSDNQAKYNIDLSKPRFEIFPSELQSEKMTEWYIPTTK